LGRRDGRPSDLSGIDRADLAAAAAAIVNEITHATGEREISGSALSELQVDVKWLVADSSNGGADRLARRAARRSDRIELIRVPGAGHAIALDSPETIQRSIHVIETGLAAHRSGRI
jgi:pimeloyl-ACP methyl ester carboxylesterase